jgi:hypothetical protein
MKLKFLAGEFAICQFSPDQQIPDWVSSETNGELLATMKTAEELTIVCSQVGVPEGTKSSLGWRCFRVDQTLSFDMVGVIAKLTELLALAKIPVFVISTYNTDYVLIPGPQQQTATRELEKAGYDIV